MYVYIFMAHYMTSWGFKMAYLMVWVLLLAEVWLSRLQLVAGMLREMWLMAEPLVVWM